MRGRLRVSGGAAVPRVGPVDRVGLPDGAIRTTSAPSGPSRHRLGHVMCRPAQTSVRARRRRPGQSASRHARILAGNAGDVIDSTTIGIDLGRTVRDRSGRFAP
jgi:hypothetical protein